MKKIFLLLAFIGLMPPAAPAQTTPDTAATSYLLPAWVEGVRQPVISLNGQWRFKPSAQGRWTTLAVPGEAAMQGYAIEHDKPFFYRREFSVPADYAGHRVVLRFDGVYSHARLSVNGRYVREHHGGFTRWETDITPYVKPGRRNTVELQVTDRLDDISYASGYAHHPVGGILRDVTVFALPEDHIADCHVETPLDSLCRDAHLRLSCTYRGAGGARLDMTLTAPDGATTPAENDAATLREGGNTLERHVRNPLKWDAEHPNLYRLTLTLRRNGKALCRYERNVGFREVRVDGNRLLVNGRPVKLRGACRHDIHPTLGRTTSAELDSTDALLFKRANMNFVRTSHYPPTERFLDFCDRFGVYVECETAVCFVSTYRQKNYAPAGNSQDDPEYTGRYVGQCREMVAAHRSHPSVIMWSIGNESRYGLNIQKSWDWIKANDSTRPVIFSYPGLAREKKAAVFDILSMHYQDTRGNIDQYGMSARNFQGHGLPTLFDEWAHPACYTYATLRDDPGIREFWGQSLDRMWSGLFDTQGGLGGAIWGYVDETFAIPRLKTGEAWWKTFAHTAKPEGFRGECVGYGEWGIVDVWRREKPEFWATKKAYSPVYIAPAVRYLPYVVGQPVTLPVQNRFDHTDFSEIKAAYTYRDRKRPLALPALAPHEKGVLSIPAEEWQDGDSLLLEFFTADGELIDAFQPALGSGHMPQRRPETRRPLTVSHTDTAFVIEGEDFRVPVSRLTGLITGAETRGTTIIDRGPYLNFYVNYNHLTGAEVRTQANHYTAAATDWTMKSVDCALEGDNAVATVEGTCGPGRVTYRIVVTPRGELSVSYTTEGLPNGYLREAGLVFRLPDAFDNIDWHRRGYWSYYPDGAFAGNRGSAPLTSRRQAAYGKRPEQPWQYDTHNYYYWSDAGAGTPKPLTQSAKGMKENIYCYTLSGGKMQLSVVAPAADVACRLVRNADGSLTLCANNRWDYPEIAWGNYCKVVEALPCYGQITLQLR